jgi:hypothetical protein
MRDSRALYIASAILFLLPWSLLFGSWIAFHRANVAAPLPAWRRTLVTAALFVACASTVLNMAWNGSWLHYGGSPHGMGAGPGLWQHLGPFLLWSFTAATFLGFFGKGKARFLMVGCLSRCGSYFNSSTCFSSIRRSPTVSPALEKMTELSFSPRGEGLVKGRVLNPGFTEKMTKLERLSPNCGGPERTNCN